MPPEDMEPTNRKPGSFPWNLLAGIDPTSQDQPSATEVKVYAPRLAGLAGIDPAGVFPGNYVT